MSSTERDGLAGWPLVLLLAATHLSVFMDRTLVALVAQPLKQTYGLSDAQLGLLQGSAFALFHAAALPLAGILCDRGHRRAILLAGIAASVLATASFGLASTFAVLVACRLAQGLGQAGIAPAALALMTHRLPRGRLGFGVSVFTAAGSMGRSLALLGGGALLAVLAGSAGVLPLAHWQSLFLLLGLPGLLLLPFAALIVEPPARTRSRLRPALVWLVRRRRTYLPHFGAAVAAMLVGQSLIAWAPTFYVRAYGLPPSESGMTLGLILLCAAPLGHLAGGFVLDRMRRRSRPFPASDLLAGGLCLVLPASAAMTLAPSLTLSLAGFAVLGAALGTTSPAALAGIQFLTPTSLRGRITGLFVSAITLIALGTGPLAIGLLNDRVFGAGGVGAAMLSLFGPVSVTGIALAVIAGRTRRRPARPRRTRRISPAPVANRQAGLVGGMAALVPEASPGPPAPCRSPSATTPSSATPTPQP